MIKSNSIFQVKVSTMNRKRMIRSVSFLGPTSDWPQSICSTSRKFNSDRHIFSYVSMDFNLFIRARESEKKIFNPILAESTSSPISQQQLPLIVNRQLEYPHPKFSPIQAWLETLGQKRDEKLGIVDLHPSIWQTSPR